MKTENSPLINTRYRKFFILCFAISGGFLSFNTYNNSTQAKQQSVINWTKDVRFWIMSVVNNGEGYNFAIEEDKNIPVTYKKRYFDNAAKDVSLISSYNSEINFVQTNSSVTSDNELAVQTSIQSPSAETNALNLLTSYVPAELLKDLSETQAEGLINRVSSLPAGIIEKIKQNPQIVYEAKNISRISDFIRSH